MSKSMQPREVLEHIVIRLLHENLVTYQLGIHVRVDDKLSDNPIKDARYKLWQLLYEPLYDQFCDFFENQYELLRTSKEIKVFKENILEQLKPPV
jgi:hypothetical protein